MNSNDTPHRTSGMPNSTAPYYPANFDLHFTLLSAEDEYRLFAEARAGNEESRTFLIQNHLLFAAMHARKLSKGRLPDADVISGANLALMKAFERFDHTRRSRFTAYLKPFIQGEISALWKDFFKNSHVVSESEPSTIPESYAEDLHTEESDAEHVKSVREVLLQCRGVLNKHEQQVIDRHYGGEESFADIARSRGVTREAIRASHGRAVAKLKRALKQRGVTRS